MQDPHVAKTNTKKLNHKSNKLDEIGWNGYRPGNHLPSYVHCVKLHQERKIGHSFSNLTIISNAKGNSFIIKASPHS